MTLEPEVKKEEVTTTDYATSLSPEQYKEKVLAQVEFYFGDSNLPSDEFLFKATTKNKEGWVPIALLSSFTRMRPYSNIEWNLEALKTSKALLEVNEDGTMIRRKIPLVSNAQKQLKASIYAKGFGEEDSGLLNELLEYFSEFGAVAQIRLRRADDKKFKGSVFVEFQDEATVQKFLDAKPTYKDTPLEVSTKEDYVKRKAAEKGIDLNKPQTNNPNRKFNAFRYMKELESGARSARPAFDPSSVKYEPGCLIAFEFPNGKVPHWTALKDYYKAIKPGAFISIPPGLAKGTVEFKEPTEPSLLEAAEFNIEGAEKPTYSLVEGDDEKEYHVGQARRREAAVTRDDERSSRGGHRDRDNGRGRGGRGRGRGGRGNGRDRRGDRDDRSRGRGRGRDRNDRRDEDGENGELKRKRDDVIPEVQSKVIKTEDGPVKVETAVAAGKPETKESLATETKIKVEGAGV